MKELNEDEIVEMSPEFFHGFLAIGTLGSVSIITKEAITPKDATPPEIVTGKEIIAAENELQCLNKLKKLIEKEVHDDTEEYKDTIEYLNEYSETPATKEDAKEQKTMPDNHFKKDAKWPTSYKGSRKSNNGIKGGTRVLPFIKKMLKKLDFTSCCSPSFAGVDAINCDSTEKITSKVDHLTSFSY